MAIDFKALKKNRENDLTKLNTELSKLSSPQANNQADSRFWKLTADKAGNGSAVIRFLPAPQEEDMPFVRYWDHAFQGPSGQWYIENSLTTLGQNDPVSEYNQKLWATGIESNKELCRARKRRLVYISNIYVVKDPANPDNEGKVFLFKYGKKIFEKLNDLMNPEFEDETPTNPFDFWEGANLRLRIRRDGKFPTYDKSEFDKPAPLLSDDDALEVIWKAEYKLQPFVDPSNFKSYDELKARLDRVLALKSDDNKPAASTPPWDDDEKPAETAPKAIRSKPSRQTVDEDDDDDETADYFRRLAETDDE